MASQITHIPYAKKAISTFLRGKDLAETEFYIGTLFPDIRYLGVIDRERTHVVEPSLEELNKIEGSFELGMYIHSIVDIERERTLTRLGLYKIIEPTTTTVYALKFIEDEISYPLVDDWGRYIEMLKTVLPEEQSLVGDDSASKWHAILREYFNQPPSFTTMLAMASNLKRITPELMASVKDNYDKIKSNREVMAILDKTYENLFLES